MGRASKGLPPATPEIVESLAKILGPQHLSVTVETISGRLHRRSLFHRRAILTNPPKTWLHISLLQTLSRVRKSERCWPFRANVRYLLLEKGTCAAAFQCEDLGVQGLDSRPSLFHVEMKGIPTQILPQKILVWEVLVKLPFQVNSQGLSGGLWIVCNCAGLHRVLQS